MKRKSLFPEIYLIAVTVIMYLPILFVMIYSVNLSKIKNIDTYAKWKSTNK